MGLFQKRSDVGSNLPLYSLSQQHNLLVIGLGNPGKDYQSTRHNIGFSSLDHFARAHQAPDWAVKKKLKTKITMFNVGASRLILAKPTTFMNNSGEAVAALQKFYNINSKNILVVHDELDLNFGQLMLKFAGQSAGHNGVQSIIERLGDDFWRLRIGIKAKSFNKDTGSDFVLNKFSAAETKQLTNLYREVTALLTESAVSSDGPQADRRSFLV